MTRTERERDDQNGEWTKTRQENKERRGRQSARSKRQTDEYIDRSIQPQGYSRG